MGFDLTLNSRLGAQEQTKELSLALEIDGLSTVLGNLELEEIIRIGQQFGDPGVGAFETLIANDGFGTGSLVSTDALRMYACEFTPNKDFRITDANVRLSLTSTVNPVPTGTFKINIWDDSAGLPNAIVGTSDTVDPSTFPTTSASVAFTFSTPVDITSGTVYYIATDCSGVTFNGANFIALKSFTGAGEDIERSTDGGSTWSFQNTDGSYDIAGNAITDGTLLIGDDWVIGGSTPIDDQEVLMTMEGTSNKITQQLNQDRGLTAGVSSLQVSFIDKDQKITKLISPGFDLDDILAKKCKLRLGFKGRSSYPEDYITIFRGLISDFTVNAGKVTFSLNHPDQKKRQEIYNKIDTDLDGAVGAGDGTLDVTDASDILFPIAGPDATFDSSVSHYVLINDEIIKYTGITGTTLTGLVRGQFNTTAAAHGDGDSVSTFYRLQGNAIDLALKLMLSGWNGNFIDTQPLTNFRIVDGAGTIPNAIFFRETDLVDKYNITIGDYCTTAGASNGANNVSSKQITNIVQVDNGYYIVVGGVSFVDELDSAATIGFRSQYDTLGEGLKLSPDEVDIAQHIKLQRQFWSSLNYDFYLKDTINGREFLEQEIYLPGSAYSLPRKSQASVGFTIGPIPDRSTVTLNETNIRNAQQIKVKRSINRNLYNTIVYKFDVSPTEDRFLRGTITTNATSKARIPIGNKTFSIEATGMRSGLNGQGLAQLFSNRRLERYKFGAESMNNVQPMFKDAFQLEVGDVIVIDGSQLELPDFATGKRGASPKLVEITNKSLDLKTGEITLEIVNTAFEVNARYGLISPASRIKSASDQKTFVIEETFNSEFGINEFKKWDRFENPSVRVHDPSFATRDAVANIASISGNTITLETDLGFTPLAGDFMELSSFNDQKEDITILYTFMVDAGLVFDDGSDPYLMI